MKSVSYPMSINYLIYVENITIQINKGGRGGDVKFAFEIYFLPFIAKLDIFESFETNFFFKKKKFSGR